jgi:adenylate cyclase
MPVVRKLAAVVVADVVGYSRLMERDEAGTHQRLRSLNDELVATKIAEHGGRTVKTTGDGMLLEFRSATSALRCAVEIQREMGVRNLYAAPDERIDFRMGINLGDVIVDGSDIFGDGVNVAARLEALADPGGICVTSAVREQVHEELDVEFIDVGVQRVKNIFKPIRVFRISLAKGVSPNTATRSEAERTSRLSERRLPRRRRVLIGAGGAAAAVVVLTWVIWHYSAPSIPTRTVSASGPPARSIVVVPFDAPADDGVLRTLSSELSADVARALADTVRDADIVSAGVGDVKAHYRVEGEVRAAGDDVVVTTRLIDAPLGKQLGSDQRSIARSRLAQEHEQLVARLTYAIRDSFENAERRRAAAPLPRDATAQDMVDRGRLLLANNPEDLRALHEARKFFDQAIERDPSLSPAWSARVGVGFNEFLRDYTADRDRLIGEMDRDSIRAVELDNHDPFAWFARTQALMFQSRFDAAFAANDRARALDPTRFFIQRGFLYLYSGRAAEALSLAAARKSMLARTDPELLVMTCAIHAFLGNYRQVIADCEQAAAGFDTYFEYLYLAAAYAQMGDMARAAAAKAELLRRVPEFTIGRLEGKQLSNDPTFVQQTRENLLPGLRKAGVPE